ncbi:DUF3347 domain-containing protein [Niabella aurantiaca]|uniref:DUF3347 domain-containing protein n=1 Tax=Niabella aurantiaca TaxID=379900 RepID=UPI0003664973|nr:DUF3347 domain-containing protein [Niabella aurantiaca]
MKYFLLWGVVTMVCLSCNPATKDQLKAEAVTARPAGAHKQVTASNKAFPAAPVLNAYFKLGAALFAENAPIIAEAATALQKELQAVRESAFPAAQQEIVREIVEASIENAEHIAVNADNLKHQREHFQLLSNDLYDLVKTAGTGATVYKFVCPALNDHKGGSWLSNQQELKNPYTGTGGNDCGTIDETLK